jgi:uroporphyrinogen-III decarboxylase
VRRVIAAGSSNVRAFGEDFERKPDIDPVEYKSILQGHGKPMLYCITAKLISRGSPGEISDKVRDVIAKIGAGGGVTMYGAMVPKETPPENVHALVRTTKEIGRYPIS